MEVQEQIDELKDNMTQLAFESSKTERMINRLSREMKDFKNEMKDFKNEMKDFKNEMKDFKDEMKDFKDEMKDFKNEKKDFKDEIGEYTNRADKQRIEMNQQWGNLANKMGTVVEDIIVPAVRPLILKYFKEDIIDLMIRRNKFDKKRNIKGEYDAIALTDNYIYLFEVKSNPNKEYLADFKQNIEKFTLLFPEYSGKKIIPIFGGLWVNPGLADLCSKEGVYLMAYREWDFMDILNFENIQTAN